VAATSVRLAFDGVADSLGLALPLTPERVCSPEALLPLLRDHGVDPLASVMGGAEATPLDIRAESSNCNNAVIALEYPPSVAASGAALPRTAFLKLPAAEAATRLFCNVIRVWELECRFYRVLAPRVPMRVPRAYAVVHRRTRFALLLEDLREDPSVELFTNADMRLGPDLQRVKRCLETLARLHASFQGVSCEEREALLPADLHPFASPFMVRFGRLTGALAIRRCQARAPELLTDELVALFERALEHWEALLGWWYREPLTLNHGDSHLGNFFADGNDMGMLDWQAVHWGKGMRDVQYLLIDSLPSQHLEAREQQLVQHYLSALATHGVDLSFEEGWEQYRALSFQTWMTIVVSLGLGALTEKDALMKEILSRSIAAIRRLRFAEWLDALADPPSLS
jgi:hypothetical protein